MADKTGNGPKGGKKGTVTLPDNRFPEGLAELKSMIKTMALKTSVKSYETPEVALERQVSGLRDQFAYLRRLPELASDSNAFHELIINASYSFLRRKLYDVILRSCSSTFWDSFALVEAERQAKMNQTGTAALLRVEEEDHQSRLTRFTHKVQATVVTNVCEYHLTLAKDESFSHPGTAIQCLRNLQKIQEGMKDAFPFSEDLYFTIYSASIYIYDCCLPLIKAGYNTECVTLLGWCILSVEATLPLTDVKFLPWRTRLYQTLCICYENMNCWEEAYKVTKRLLAKIEFLHEVENSDIVPPPAKTTQILESSRGVATTLNFKYEFFKGKVEDPVAAALGSRQGGKGEKKANPGGAATGPILERLQSTYSEPKERILAVLDALTLDSVRVIKSRSKQVSADVMNKVSVLCDALEELTEPYVDSFYKVRQPETPEEEPIAATIDSKDKKKDDKKKDDKKDKPKDKKGASTGSSTPEPMAKLEDLVTPEEHVRMLNLLLGCERVDLFDKWMNIMQTRLSEAMSGLSQFPATATAVQFGTVQTLQSDGEEGETPMDLEDSTLPQPQGTVENGFSMLLQEEVTFLSKARMLLSPTPENATEFAELLLEAVTGNSGNPGLIAQRPDLFEDAAMQLYEVVTGPTQLFAEFPTTCLFAILQTLLTSGSRNVLFMANVAQQAVKNLELLDRNEDALEAALGMLQVIQKERERIVRSAKDAKEVEGVIIQPDDPDDRKITTCQSILYKTLYALHTELQCAALRIRMKLGVKVIAGVQVRKQQKSLTKTLKREEQQHIFGEMSRKEKRIAETVKAAPVPEPPVQAPSEEVKLEEECKGNPFLMCLFRIQQCNFRVAKPDHQALLDQAMSAAREAEMQLESLREQHNVPPGMELNTVTSFPPSLLWGLICLKAYEKQCPVICKQASERALAEFVIAGPEYAIWDFNPISQDRLNNEFIRHQSTPLLQTIAKVLLSVSDSTLMGLAPKHDTMDERMDDGIDRECYKALPKQKTCLRVANKLLMGIQLGAYVTDPGIIVLGCHRLWNCVSRLLETTAKPFILLRPLTTIAAILPALPRGLFHDLNLQYLAARVCHELFQIASQVESFALSQRAVAQFLTLYGIISGNPTDYMQRFIEATKARVAIPVDETEAVDDGKKDKGNKAKDKAPPQTSTAEPVGPEEIVPLEWHQLFTYALLHVRGSAPSVISTVNGCLKDVSNEASLPPIWVNIAPLLQANAPQFAIQAIDELEQFKDQKTYPLIATELAMALIQHRQIDQARTLVLDVLETTKAKYTSLWERENNVMAEYHIESAEEALAKAKKPDPKKAKAKEAKPAKPAKGGKGGKGAPPEPSTPREELEAARELHIKNRAQIRLCRLCCHVRFRQKRSELLQTDVPHRARCKVLLAAVDLQKILKSDPPGGPEYKKPRAAASLKPLSPNSTKGKESKAAKPPKPPKGAKAEVVEEAEPEDDNSIRARYWADRVEVIQRLSEAAVLFCRVGKYKHAFNAIVFLWNTSRLFFGDIAGDPFLLGSSPFEVLDPSVTNQIVVPVPFPEGPEDAPMPLPKQDTTRSISATGSTRADSSLGGTLTLKPDIDYPVDDGLKLCWKYFLAAAECLVEIVQACSKGEDLRQYQAPLTHIFYHTKAGNNTEFLNTAMQFWLKRDTESRFAQKDQQRREKEQRSEFWFPEQTPEDAEGDAESAGRSSRPLTADTFRSSEVPTLDKPPMRSTNTATTAATSQGLSPSPPKKAKTKKVQAKDDPSEAYEEIEWAPRLGDIPLQGILTAFRSFLYGLERAEKVHKVVELGTVMEDLTRHHFSEQIVPIVIRCQAVEGSAMAANQALMAKADRDRPRASEFVSQARLTYLRFKLKEKDLLVNEAKSVVGGKSGTQSVVGGKSVGTRSMVSSHWPGQNKALKEVTSSYQQCISYLRSKAAHLLTIQTLDELGRVQSENRRPRDALTSWNDAVDVAFGTVHACKVWRELTAPSPQAMLEKYGAWKLLQSTSILAKLGQLSICSNHDQSLEYCMFAATLAQTLNYCSVTHPARPWDFGTYKPDCVIPNTDLFHDANRCDGMQLLHGLQFIAWTLIQAEHPILALPTASLMHYIATHVVRDIRHVVQARILGARALAQLGHLQDAYACLVHTLQGYALPSIPLLHLPIVLQPEAKEEKPADGKGGKGGSKGDKPKKGGGGTPTPDMAAEIQALPAFMNHLPIESEENLLALDRLSAMVSNSNLVAMYGSFLADSIHLAIGYFLIQVASTDRARSLATRSSHVASTPAKAGGGGFDAGGVCNAALLQAEQILSPLLMELTPEDVDSADVSLHCTARYYQALIHNCRSHFSLALDELRSCVAVYNTKAPNHTIKNYTYGVPSFLSIVGLYDLLAWQSLLTDVLFEKRMWTACKDACNAAITCAQDAKYTYGQRGFKLTKVKIDMQNGDLPMAMQSMDSLLEQCTRQHWHNPILPRALAIAAQMSMEVDVLANSSEPANFLSAKRSGNRYQKQAAESVRLFTDLVTQYGLNPELTTDVSHQYHRHCRHIHELMHIQDRLAEMLIIKGDDYGAADILEQTLKINVQGGAVSPHWGITAKWLLGRAKRGQIVSIDPSSELTWGLAQNWTPEDEAFDGGDIANMKVTDQAMTLLEDAINLNVQSGTHDYELLRQALMEVVGYYGSRPVPGKAVGHCYVAINCLVLAGRVSQMQRELYSNVGQQKEAVIDNVDDMPECISADLRGFRARENDVQTEFHNQYKDVPGMGAVALAPGGKAGGEASIPEGAITTHTILHYFGKLMQEMDTDCCYNPLREIKLIGIREHLQKLTLDKEVVFATPPSLYQMPELKKGMVCTQMAVLGTDPAINTDPPKARNPHLPPPPLPPRPPGMAWFYVLVKSDAGEVKAKGDAKAPAKKAAPNGKAPTGARGSVSGNEDLASAGLPLMGMCMLEQGAISDVHALLSQLKYKYYLEDLRGEESALISGVGGDASKGAKKPGTAPGKGPGKPAAEGGAEDVGEEDAELEQLRAKVVQAIVDLILRKPKFPPQPNATATSGSTTLQTTTGAISPDTLGLSQASAAEAQDRKASAVPSTGDAPTERGATTLHRVVSGVCVGLRIGAVIDEASLCPSFTLTREHVDILESMFQVGGGVYAQNEQVCGWISKLVRFSKENMCQWLQ